MLLGLTIALSASLCALEHGRPLDGNVEKVSREESRLDRRGSDSNYESTAKTAAKSQ